MLYNSYIFIMAFLPIVLAGYYLLNHFKRYQGALAWLCGASLFFYGYFNWSYLPIIVVSILGNFALSKILLKNLEHRGYFQKILLTVGLAGNIGGLFYFKYYDFFIQNINKAFNTNFSLLHLLLPLGISFFTFQQLSYVIDSYLGGVPRYSFLEYTVFVTFFPQLIAGPIVLHHEVIPQFADLNNRKWNWEHFSEGLYAFFLGLGKKVLLADTFAKAVEVGFSDVSALGTANAIIVMLSYTFQIYFDFSGYCDMATGIGKFFNIDIPMNFNSPYRAVTITEFWNRWHMTLTRFFTTYIYIPLGGNRKGAWRTYFNVMVVFLVSGLWHGANWTFILWGLLHGIASVVTRMFKKQIERWHPAFSWLCTFLFINITWVIFRADSVNQVVAFMRQLTNLNFTSILSGIKEAFLLPEIKWMLDTFHKEKYSYMIWAIFLIFGLFGSLQMKNTNEKVGSFQPTVGRAAGLALLAIWGIISLSGVSVFLYWNF